MQPKNQLAVDPETEFPKVEKLLYSIAWDFARRYGMPFEEARSDAYVGFMKACRNYKPGRGTKFSTWARLVVWGQLKSLLMQRASKYVETVELNEELVGEASAEPNIATLELCEKLPARGSLAEIICTLFYEAPREMLSTAENMSEDAQNLLFLFLESPGEIRYDRAEEIARLRHYYIRQHGPQKAEAAFAELRRTLTETFA